MSHWQEGDCETAQDMRQGGVLVDLDLAGLDVARGAIALVCADGDQFHDLYTHLCARVNAADGAENRVHPFSWNGAALLVPDDSPLSVSEEWVNWVVEQIHGAMILKGMKTIFLFVHGPCGAAGLKGVRFRSVLQHLAAAKARLEPRFEGLVIVPCAHVDWGEGKKRTYRLDEAAFDACFSAES